MTEWEKTVNDKVCQILKVLEGLNVYEAKKVIEALGYGIERNSIINLKS